MILYVYVTKCGAKKITHDNQGKPKQRKLGSQQNTHAHRGYIVSTQLLKKRPRKKS